MTLDELKQLRDQASRAAAELARAERGLGMATKFAETAARARDTALANAETAERRVAELISLRDAIPAIQAEADSEELMADRAATVLAHLSDDIGRLLELVARVSASRSVRPTSFKRIAVPAPRA